MSQYNPLSWQNENALSGCPFSIEPEIQNFIVDAKFVQFDGFVPTLDYIIVQPDKIYFAITFDCGQVVTSNFLKETYDLGEEYRSLRLYTSNNDRYLGVLVFGLGAADLWQNYIGRKLTFSQSFSPTTVRSVPFKDAVYLFDGNYGELQLSRTSLDSSVFYNTSAALNSITFNAVAGHSVTQGTSVQILEKKGLRKINLVPPVNNNINLMSNDVIKIKTFNASSLTIELVTGSATQAFVIPSLIA